jgi:hypothetical protein
MLQYEQPVLDDFRARFGEDAREVDPADPRLEEVRAAIMNRFVRNVHDALAEIAAKRARKFELSVWVWPSTQGVWMGGTPMEEGLDVKGWMRDGLLDSVICQEGIDPEYMKLGEATGCRFVLFTGYRGDTAMSPETLTKAYEAGVTDFAYWDMDAVIGYPEAWNWLRRCGHRDEMADWKRFDPGTRLIPLTKLGHVDVEHGLAQDVYSGG